MQGSRNARSRKCAVPPPRSLGATGNRTPAKLQRAGASAGGRIPLGPPSPADGMGGGGTSLRVALPELAISPLRLGGDGCRSADDQRTILGPVPCSLSRCLPHSVTLLRARRQRLRRLLRPIGKANNLNEIRPGCILR